MSTKTSIIYIDNENDIHVYKDIHDKTDVIHVEWSEGGEYKKIEMPSVIWNSLKNKIKKDHERKNRASD